jgi:hypothetical protein
MTATSEPHEGGCGSVHCGFEQSGDSHDHHFGRVDFIDQPIVTGSGK